MPTIVDALKAKYPDATGNTIAEVINNSGSESGPSGETPIRIIDAVYNTQSETWNLDITNGELVELMTSGTIVFVKIVRSEEVDGITQHITALSHLHSFITVEGSEGTDHLFYMNEVANIYGWWVGNPDYPELNPWFQED